LLVALADAAEVLALPAAAEKIALLLASVVLPRRGAEGFWGGRCSLSYHTLPRFYLPS
jgi:hypothetical protein